MATIPDDIKQRIERDFGKRNAKEITELLLTKIPSGGNGTRERHLRCILYLAKGNRKKLDKYIEACVTDPRDVMVWAEGIDMKRDFNKPFGCSATSSTTTTQKVLDEWFENRPVRIEGSSSGNCAQRMEEEWA